VGLALGRNIATFGHVRVSVPKMAVMAALAAVLAARPAAAVDPFEIQVYDGTANPPGVPGLELHVNGVAAGLTTAPAPELAPNHQTHFTLEPALGLTQFWEIGAYLQSALLPDGAFSFAGAKLRSKLVTRPGWRAHLRLGCNIELSWLPAKFEAQHWGGEIRNIAAWENARWMFAVNPIIEVSFQGTPFAFAPAATAVFKIRGLASVGFEYYGDVDARAHYLFQVVNIWTRQIEINAGVGEGLTSASNALIGKLILGYRWE
jgi:hypothetical protein